MYVDTGGPSVPKSGISNMHDRPAARAGTKWACYRVKKTYNYVSQCIIRLVRYFSAHCSTSMPAQHAPAMSPCQLACRRTGQTLRLPGVVNTQLAGGLPISRPWPRCSCSPHASRARKVWSYSYLQQCRTRPTCAVQQLKTAGHICSLLILTHEGRNHV